MNCPKDKNCCWDCENGYIEYNASGKPSEIICCLELDFCGTPCKFMEDKINRLEEENERLKNHCDKLMDKVEELIYECDCAKQEAREEFAEELDKRFPNNTHWVRPREVVNNLVEEMRNKQ